jgi:hypothetical protein
VPATAFAGNFGSTVGVPFAADGMTLGLRNTPTAMYASFTPPFSVQADGAKLLPIGGQFLDGRAAGLEQQARMPFFAAGEMNLGSDAELSDAARQCVLRSVDAGGVRRRDLFRPEGGGRCRHARHRGLREDRGLRAVSPRSSTDRSPAPRS